MTTPARPTLPPTPPIEDQRDDLFFCIRGLVSEAEGAFYQSDPLPELSCNGFIAMAVRRALLGDKALATALRQAVSPRGTTT